jgi:hypothetical protein
MRSPILAVLWSRWTTWRTRSIGLQPRLGFRAWFGQQDHQPGSQEPSESRRYGLGFWLHQAHDTVLLEGFDAGVSFRTVHDPIGGVTHTVLSNTSAGAWPITRRLSELLTI